MKGMSPALKFGMLMAGLLLLIATPGASQPNPLVPDTSDAPITSQVLATSSVIAGRSAPNSRRLRITRRSSRGGPIVGLFETATFEGS